MKIEENELKYYIEQFERVENIKEIIIVGEKEGIRRISY